MKTLRSWGLVAALCAAVMVTPVCAKPVEINGDNVEYSIDGEKVIATGNVEIKYLDTVLTSDYAEFIQKTNQAYARGHVVIVNPSGRTDTEEITYNFVTKGFETVPLRLEMFPAYVTGQSIERRDNGRTVLTTATYTTSDYDKPGYHWAASKATLDNNNTLLTLRNVRLKFGNIPVFYWPKLTKRLDQKKLSGKYRIGYKDDWGAYVLSEFPYTISEYVDLTLHVDYRELLDLAWGVDASYRAPETGHDGMIRTYYTKERDRGSSHWFENDSPPTVEKQRYVLEWRHAYRPKDEDHFVMAQLSKLSDSDVFSKYFERRSDIDPAPATFLTGTQYLPYGSLSAQADPRVNNYTSQTEHLPEVRYDLPHVKVAGSNLYWKQETSAAYVTHRSADIFRDDEDNARVDWDQEFSYPMTAGMLHITPFAGSRHTLFRDTLDETNSVIRDAARGGVTASTKFFNTYDVDTKFLKQEYHGLRHVITPSVTYEKLTDPDVDPDQLYPFDDVDLLDASESIEMSLENKLQTKRNNASVDVLRAVISTNYNLEKEVAATGIETIDFEMEVTPVTWMWVVFSSQYDTNLDKISAFNVDTSVSYGNGWVGFGHRYSASADDLAILQFGYAPHRKWTAYAYEYYNMETKIFQDQQYHITRDLHSWLMDASVRLVERSNGEQEMEFWLMFKIKDFLGPNDFQRYGSRYAPPRVGELHEIDREDHGYQPMMMAPLPPPSSP